MLEKNPSVVKGRRVSLYMVPTIEHISPRNKSPTQQCPETTQIHQYPAGTTAASPTRVPASAPDKRDPGQGPSPLGRRPSLGSEKRAILCRPVLKVRSSFPTHEHDILTYGAEDIEAGRPGKHHDVRSGSLDEDMTRGRRGCRGGPSWVSTFDEYITT
ncbi:hypothetical protein HPB48_011078 [Haemaphysalis longicornis]|uniref:Uncharacterized protein n=1 Tax=Haemaphysalis longicornis TaxID=44386 RepID=A0A9J6GHP5_HAELO|nr:hypothetical protein HPB48_011078 [Haemaphysalis longicornis]